MQFRWVDVGRISGLTWLANSHVVVVTVVVESNTVCEEINSRNETTIFVLVIAVVEPAFVFFPGALVSV